MQHDLSDLGRVLGLVEVGRPLPDVADHVDQPVAVGRKRADRRRALEAVLVQVLHREIALPGVGEIPILGQELVAPGVIRAVEPAAGGHLPFGFGRQLLAVPAGERLGVGVADVHDRMLVASGDGAALARRLPPVGALHPVPPVGEVAQVDLAGRLDEHQRAGEQLVGKRARIVLGPGRDLAEGHVAGRLDEAREALVGHRRAIDPEAVDGDPVHRPLFRVVLVRSHAERPPRDPDHVGGTAAARAPVWPPARRLISVLAGPVLIRCRCTRSSGACHHDG